MKKARERESPVQSTHHHHAMNVGKSPKQSRPSHKDQSKVHLASNVHSPTRRPDKYPYNARKANSPDKKENPGHPYDNTCQNTRSQSRQTQATGKGYWSQRKQLPSPIKNQRPRNPGPCTPTQSVSDTQDTGKGYWSQSKQQLRSPISNQRPINPGPYSPTQSVSDTHTRRMGHHNNSPVQQESSSPGNTSRLSAKNNSTISDMQGDHQVDISPPPSPYNQYKSNEVREGNQHAKLYPGKNAPTLPHDPPPIRNTATAESAENRSSATTYHPNATRNANTMIPPNPALPTKHSTKNTVLPKPGEPQHSINPQASLPVFTRAEPQQQLT